VVPPDRQERSVDGIQVRGVRRRADVRASAQGPDQAPLGRRSRDSRGNSDLRRDTKGSDHRVTGKRPRRTFRKYDIGRSKQEVIDMKPRLIVALSSVVLLVAVRPVVAHHAFAAEFDSNKPLTLKGTVTEMEWINPHAWLHVAVKAPDGTTTNWMCEA